MEDNNVEGNNVEDNVSSDFDLPLANDQGYQDDVDTNNLLGDYKLARSKLPPVPPDDKKYVVPKEAFDSFMNKQKKVEEKKEEKKEEEVKIVSREQRARAKPVPMQKKEEKPLTLKDITANYKPRVSAFHKKKAEKAEKAEKVEKVEKAEEKKEEENDDEIPKDLKSCQKKFTNLNNKFNGFKKTYDDESAVIVHQFASFDEDMKTVNVDIDTLIDKVDRLEDVVRSKGIHLEKIEAPSLKKPKEVPPNLGLLFIIKDKIQHLEKCLEMVENEQMKQKVCQLQLPIIYGNFKYALGDEQWNQFYTGWIAREVDFENIVRRLKGKIDDIYQHQAIDIPIPKLRF